MPPPNPETTSPKTAIAVLAKAPVPGFAKTRLIPSIGAHAAAVLQERLTEQAVATALTADIGPVTLWAAPDARHPSFIKMVIQQRITLRPQPDGDLGARMLAATAATGGPTLVIGTDCPALTPVHLRGAARALHEGAEVVLIPAEDGGYVLIGTRTAQPGLFSGIAWGSATVLAETRTRIMARSLVLNELPPLWDVDTEDDLARLEREIPALSL
jgi:rSAM/selenodomain-associated transferase 1